MGLESEPVRVRASGAPSRCPYCHDAMDHEREAWLACAACLARHHAPCWTEGAGCASCGARGSIGPGARAEEDVPVLEVTLEARREPAGSFDAETKVLFREGRDASFAVVVRNETGKDQRVELRRVPAWLRTGPAIEQVASGEAARFVVTAIEGAVPSGNPIDIWLGKAEDRFAEARASASGTFVVSSDDEARNVRVSAFREPSRRSLVGIGLLSAFWFLPFGMITLGFCLSWLLRPGPAPGNDVQSAFLRAVRASDARTARHVLGALFLTLAAVVAAFAVVGS